MFERETIKLTFKNNRGHVLSAALEKPVGAPPYAYGVMSSCFTCVKESIATMRLSRGLAEKGYAVLRYDSTGVGQSEGDSFHSSFTTRVDDLKAAITFLEADIGNVSFLLGHSLGGTASLAVMAHQPRFKLAVTIGSPASPAMVLDGFEKQGRIKIHPHHVEIDVLGTPYLFDHAFVQALRDYPYFMRDMAAITSDVIICHSPSDDIVPIQNAERLYQSIPHAKTIILPETSHHLFNDNQDAINLIDKIVERLQNK